VSLHCRNAKTSGAGFIQFAERLEELRKRRRKSAMRFSAVRDNPQTAAVVCIFSSCNNAVLSSSFSIRCDGYRYNYWHSLELWNDSIGNSFRSECFSKVPNMKGSIVITVGSLLLSALPTFAQVTRNYNCLKNEKICSNMCYWMTCIHPTTQVFTRSSLKPAKSRRRRLCGATHCPHPCDPKLGFGNRANTSPDEFPFASMGEGGRTPFK